MEYIKYYDEISKRSSCRDYSDKDVSAENLAAIKEYYGRCRRLIPEFNMEMFILNGVVADKVGDKAGYNGFMIKAPKYLMLYSETGDHYLENAAFVAQALTLKMTQLGLDSCWITINDADAIKEVFAPDSDKKLAVLIAFGYKSAEAKEVRLDIKSPSNVKMVKRETGAAPKISLNDLVSYKTFGTAVNDSIMYDDLKDALIAASVSQSLLNRQPYRLILDDDMLSLVAFKDEMTSEEDEKLNYGILMFNFAAVLASHRTEDPKWSFTKPDRDLKLPKDYFFVAKCSI